MSILFSTNKPKTLLERLRWCIDQNHIETWTYDGNGDFTHTPNQFRHMAWMRPFIVEDGLAFGIIGRKDRHLTKGLYGVYHGRLAECVTNHADDLFTASVQTAIGNTRFDLFDGPVVPPPALSPMERLLLS
ncbi:hypothetical protein ACNJYD_20015 [Bradyrhizobium sp. DASA03005]|uniref:hypothetical protein n=1 Tax=Bradyrhizobium sp. SPXBL-02 TaxID=3395912 RepID=UPI003F7106D9